MTWEARTNFVKVEPGTVLCIFERGQIVGEPEPQLLGDQPIAVEVSHRWINAKIQSATVTTAILVMPDGVRYQITSLKPGELGSNIEVRGMYSRDWVVRSQIVEP